MSMLFRTVIYPIFLVFGAAGVIGMNAEQGQNSADTNVADSASQDKNLADLDVSQLMNVQVVTSVSKKEESLFGAPAAIFVLTHEDIQRGGFTNLPDALRTVPGLFVAQTNSHNWEVSTRGFSDYSNDKLLVLVDGRSVYSQELGIVRWDVLDMPMENVERIEVIRGPGGTLWGANAVNGVINIVTKSAQQMQGMMVSTSASPETGYTTTVRYGGQVGSSLNYSVFGRASYAEPLLSPFGAGAGFDHLLLPQIGARLDWTASSKDTVTLEEGSYDGRYRGISLAGPPADYLLSGNHVLLHWKHATSDRSSFEILTYCDWQARFGPAGEKRNSCDAEFQHSYSVTKRQSLIWGTSFFTTGDDLSINGTPFIPERRRTHVVSGFGQYEMDIVPGRFRVLAGTKLEHNDYTGFEFQPQARAVWTPGKMHSLWTSVSRAVRVPNRQDTAVDFSTTIGVANGLPIVLHATGNPNLGAEHLFAYELGYRFQPNPTFSLGMTTYYNQYQRLINVSAPVTQITPSEISLNTQFVNGAGAQTHGGSISAKWRPVHSWTIDGSLTETRGSPSALQATPRHMFQIQSNIDLPHKIDLNSVFYSYSSVAPGTTSARGSLQAIPAFVRFDTGARWHISPQWTLGIWGRNLQSDQHVETRDTAYGDVREGIPRSAVFQILWRSQPEDSKPK